MNSNTFTITGLLTTINVVRTSGSLHYAIIDTKNLSKISNYQWHLTSTGYLATNVFVNGTKKLQYLHQTILGLSAGNGHAKVCDHISGDRLNNTESNLRIVSSAENSANRKAYSKSGYKGVRQTKSAFVASITSNSIVSHLGTFPTAVEAARAYNEAAINIYGTSATINNV